MSHTQIDCINGQMDLVHAVVPPSSTWRHEKTGAIYRVQGACMLEASCEAAVLYQSADGGPVWARSFQEFIDGRFTKITDPQ